MKVMKCLYWDRFIRLTITLSFCDDKIVLLRTSIKVKRLTRRAHLNGRLYRSHQQLNFFYFFAKIYSKWILISFITWNETSVFIKKNVTFYNSSFWPETFENQYKHAKAWHLRKLIFGDKNQIYLFSIFGINYVIFLW